MQISSVSTDILVFNFSVDGVFKLNARFIIAIYNVRVTGIPTTSLIGTFLLWYPNITAVTPGSSVNIAAT